MVLKEDWLALLKLLLQGHSQLPFHLLNNPDTPLEELNLSKYFICHGEPLHDLKGECAHLYSEMKYLDTSPGKELHQICQLNHENHPQGLTGAQARETILYLLKTV